MYIYKSSVSLLTHSANTDTHALTHTYTHTLSLFLSHPHPYLLIHIYMQICVFYHFYTDSIILAVGKDPDEILLK